MHIMISIDRDTRLQHTRVLRAYGNDSIAIDILHTHTRQTRTLHDYERAAHSMSLMTTRLHFEFCRFMHAVPHIAHVHKPGRPRAHAVTVA